MNSGLYDIPNGNGDLFEITMGATNDGPGDNIFYYTGLRYGYGSAQNPLQVAMAHVPCKCAMIKVQHTWRVSNLCSDEPVDWILMTYDRQNNLKNEQVVMQHGLRHYNPVIIAGAWSYSSPDLFIPLNSDDHIIFKWKQTWATNPATLEHYFIMTFVKLI
jgi:hypothetical protein